MKKTTVVIFGASGDLTQRKLVPALFSLYLRGRLPEGVRIAGFAHDPLSREEFHARLRADGEQFGGGPLDAAAWEDFATRLWYRVGDFTKPVNYENLQAVLYEVEGGPYHRLYYLATPPTFFPASGERLGKAGMASEEGWWRMVIEKPFGRDLALAKALNRTIHDVFDEHQIYRIDHYLGKWAAQNILFFRFANTIFEPLCNHNYVH